MTSAKHRRSRRFLAAVGVVAALGLALLGFVAAASLLREPPHPPAFDEARDLPALPPASQNGWTIIAPHSQFFFEPGPPSTPLLSVEEGPPRRAEWDAMRGELEAWELAPEARAVLDDAFARPRFVVACELSLVETCSVLTWVHAHRAAAGLALRDAALGWDEEALARADRLLRASRDALSQPRTLVEAVAAMTLTMETVELTALLGAIVGAGEAEALSPSLRERLDTLERALSALEPASWNMEQALIGEAITIRHTLDTLPASETRRFGLTPDLARTARLSDEYIRASIAYARAPDRIAPPEPPRAGLVWRALDPVGSSMLDLLHVDPAPLVEQQVELSARTERRIALARAVLADAARRAASASE